MFSIKLRARPQPNQRLTGAAILLFVGFNVLAGGPGSLAERSAGEVEACNPQSSAAAGLFGHMS